jgi:Uncharacterized conserved protein
MDRNDEINQPKEDSLEERPAEEDELNDAPEFSQEEVEYLSSSEASPIVSIERDALAAAEAAESQAQMLRDWPVWLVASLTLLSGLAGSVQPLAARLANHPKLFSLVVPIEYYHWTKSLNVAFGLFLIYLSFNLFKKKRVAWLLALIVSLLTALLHFARTGPEYIIAIRDRDLSQSIPIYTAFVPVLTVVLLIILRKRFTVLSERDTIISGVIRLGVSALLVVAYGTVGFWLLDKRDFGINFTWGDAVYRTLREVCLLGNPDLSPHSKFANWFLDSLYLFGGLAGIYGVYSLFRPIQYELSTLPKEREIAANILDKHGNDALDHYKLSTDKSYYFSDNCCIAYTTVMNVAIGLGDPVGPTDSIGKVTESFREFCHKNDWKIAYLQVAGTNIATYEKLGLDTLKVGEDAVINLNKFATETVKGKTFKPRLKKFDKDGFVFERYAPPHAPEIIDTVETISNAWLSLPGRRERGFSLGWFDRNEVANEVLFILKDPEKKPIAFVNQVRSYRKGEASIDMMRHCEDVPNGTMDYLFAKLLLALKEEGFETFNLGLAALSGVGESPDCSLEEKAVHQIYEHMNRFFSYKGLRQYKNKFKPDWEERFLVYEGGPPGLIKSALAVTRAGTID